MNDKTLVERLMEFEKFIRGQGALDGAWFGDTRSDFKGAFWWRRFSPIKEAADTIEAQATRIEVLEAALRKAKGEMICADTYAERLIREHDAAYKVIQMAGLPTADLMGVQHRLNSEKFNLRSVLRRGRQALKGSGDGR